MAEPSIGDRELALLQHIAECGDASLRETASEFGKPLGLARSTVLTMMERLRVKGFLRRRRVRGVYRYSTTTTPNEAVRCAVGKFIHNTLGGSVSPLVAWMADRGEVSDEEFAELKALVAKLGPGRQEK